MKIFSVLLLLALVLFCGFGFPAVVDLSDPSEQPVGRSNLTCFATDSIKTTRRSDDHDQELIVVAE